MFTEVLIIAAETWKLARVPQENSGMFAHWKSTQQ